MRTLKLGLALIGTLGIAAAPGLARDRDDDRDDRGRSSDGRAGYGPLQDLGTLPGETFSDAAGINDDGVIAGDSGRACAWIPAPCSSGSSQYTIHALDLSITGEPEGTVGVSSRATGINDLGQICGQVSARIGGAGSPRPRAVVWDSHTGAPRSLGLLPGTLGGSARGINSAGHVAGLCQGRAVVWRGGPAEELPRLGTGSVSAAFAINDLGQVAGLSNKVPDGAPVPVYWQPVGEGYEVVELENLGDPFFGSYDYARAINNDGEIVGVTGLTSGVFDEDFGAAVAISALPYVWDAGCGGAGRQLRPGPVIWPADLVPAPAPEVWAAERLNGSANGNNDRGEMVGFIGVNGPLEADPAPLDFRTAAYWGSPGRRPVLLGTLGGAVSFARDINDRGAIVGLADTETGETHAFIVRRGGHDGHDGRDGHDDHDGHGHGHGHGR